MTSVGELVFAPFFWKKGKFGKKKKIWIKNIFDILASIYFEPTLAHESGYDPDATVINEN